MLEMQINIDTLQCRNAMIKAYYAYFFQIIFFKSNYHKLTISFRLNYVYNCIFMIYFFYFTSYLFQVNFLLLKGFEFPHCEVF